MNPETTGAFRFLAGLPARLTAAQAAHVLGFRARDIAILRSAGLLRPLGRPSSQGVKHYATAEIQALRHDLRWLSQATEAVQLHGRRRRR